MSGSKCGNATKCDTTRKAGARHTCKAGASKSHQLIASYGYLLRRWLRSLVRRALQETNARTLILEQQPIAPLPLSNASAMLKHIRQRLQHRAPKPKVQISKLAMWGQSHSLTSHSKKARRQTHCSFAHACGENPTRSSNALAEGMTWSRDKCQHLEIHQHLE